MASWSGGDVGLWTEDALLQGPLPWLRPSPRGSSTRAGRVAGPGRAGGCGVWHRGRHRGSRRPGTQREACSCPLWGAHRPVGGRPQLPSAPNPGAHSACPTKPPGAGRAASRCGPWGAWRLLEDGAVGGRAGQVVQGYRGAEMEGSHTRGRARPSGPRVATRGQRHSWAGSGQMGKSWRRLRGWGGEEQLKR